MQILLPIFPLGSTYISSQIVFEKRNETIYYIHSLLPIFSHDEDDKESFKFIICNLVEKGLATQSQIVEAFGITAIFLKRSLKVYRKDGIKGLFAPRKTRSKAVLTTQVLDKIQSKLNDGLTISAIAKELDLKYDTIRKAVSAGKLYKPMSKEKACDYFITKSERSVIDNKCSMGKGATNELDRAAASLGFLNGVFPKFQTMTDVPNGGVLLALPALLSCGLLKYVRDYFRWPAGYYSMESIFILLAFMALARIRSLEQIRYYAPGEWGNLLGLDRIPEVKTLREKLKLLCEQHSPEKWSAALCNDWIASEEQTGFLFYIDGHVRVYYGKQTKLPRHHVSRQRLCLRATVDYWVNANDGNPFLLVNKPIDPGLIRVLEADIIPQLKENLPTSSYVKNKPCFTLIFDREGYSPDLFKRLYKEHKQPIACITYHKYPKDKWKRHEFLEQHVHLAFNDEAKMDLAERGTRLPNGLWVREIRKLNNSGHQTSIISTDYFSKLTHIAGKMFDRWSQENFFKYMRKHYNIDGLINYDLENIPDTTKLVNPEYRKISAVIRSKTASLSNRLSKFGNLCMPQTISDKTVDAFQKEKSSLQEEIDGFKEEINCLKIKRKTIKQHIEFSELPNDDKFSQLKSNSKHFVDTIKMIAYRSETAMVNIVRKYISKSDEARNFVCAIYKNSVDILVDIKKNLLTIKFHHLANDRFDKIMVKLFEELNATETRFPMTNLRFIYQLVS